MIKKLLHIFITALLFISCEDDSTTPSSLGYTPQTTLMYMTGTDLSYFFNQNITAAKKAIAEDALGYGRFLVFKHSTSSTAELVEYKYEKGACVSETLKSYSDITSLTQDAITEVIADTKELAPANSYNLIVSGHATGWVPKERTTSSWAISPTSSSVDWGQMSSSPVVTRYLGSTNDSYFDISEFKASLEAAQTYFGYILFDECFMSSIEVAYDLRYLCDYIVASPCEIMGAGFPYDTVIPKLFANNGTEFDLQGACEEYYNYYSTYTYPSGCVAMAVTSELDALADLTRQINTMYSYDTVNTSSIQVYERLENHIFFDFEQYMLTKCNDTSTAQLFMSQMQKAFPYECRLHTERFFANIGTSASSSNDYDAYFTTITYYSGVTTSAPSTQMESEWATTTWAIDTN